MLTRRMNGHKTLLVGKDIEIKESVSYSVKHIRDCNIAVNQHFMISKWYHVLENCTYSNWFYSIFVGMDPTFFETQIVNGLHSMSEQSTCYYTFLGKHVTGETLYNGTVMQAKNCSSFTHLDLVRVNVMVIDIHHASQDLSYCMAIQLKS